MSSAFREAPQKPLEGLSRKSSAKRNAQLKQARTTAERMAVRAEEVKLSQKAQRADAFNIRRATIDAMLTAAGVIYDPSYDKVMVYDRAALEGKINGAWRNMIYDPNPTVYRTRFLQGMDISQIRAQMRRWGSHLGMEESDAKWADLFGPMASHGYLKGSTPRGDGPNKNLKQFLVGATPIKWDVDPGIMTRAKENIRKYIQDFFKGRIKLRRLTVDEALDQFHQGDERSPGLPYIGYRLDDVVLRNGEPMTVAQATLQDWEDEFNGIVEPSAQFIEQTRTTVKGPEADKRLVCAAPQKRKWYTKQMAAYMIPLFQSLPGNGQNGIQAVTRTVKELMLDERVQVTLESDLSAFDAHTQEEALAFLQECFGWIFNMEDDFTRRVIELESEAMARRELVCGFGVVKLNFLPSGHNWTTITAHFLMWLMMEYERLAWESTRKSAWPVLYNFWQGDDLASLASEWSEDHARFRKEILAKFGHEVRADLDLAHKRGPGWSVEFCGERIFYDEDVSEPSPNGVPVGRVFASLVQFEDFNNSSDKRSTNRLIENELLTNCPSASFWMLQSAAACVKLDRLERHPSFRQIVKWVHKHTPGWHWWVAAPCLGSRRSPSLNILRELDPEEPVEEQIIIDSEICFFHDDEELKLLFYCGMACNYIPSLRARLRRCASRLSVNAWRNAGKATSDIPDQQEFGKWAAGSGFGESQFVALIKGPDKVDIPDDAKPRPTGAGEVDKPSAPLMARATMRTLMSAKYDPWEASRLMFDIIGVLQQYPQFMDELPSPLRTALVKQARQVYGIDLSPMENNDDVT